MFFWIRIWNLRIPDMGDGVRHNYNSLDDALMCVFLRLVTLSLSSLILGLQLNAPPVTHLVTHVRASAIQKS
jgi:hypothetical protein